MFQRRRRARHAIEIRRDAAVQAFGNALALTGLKQKAFIAGIADEGNLREHRGHICAGQNDKRRLLHSAVCFLTADKLELLCERLLNIRGELF